QILGALKASGYLFEHEVATILTGLGYHVETSWAFMDADEEKSREIDIRAVKNVLHDPAARTQVFVELLIECKDTETPFVFLQRDKNARELESPEALEYALPRRKYEQTINEKSYKEVPA